MNDHMRHKHKWGRWQWLTLTNGVAKWEYRQCLLPNVCFGVQERRIGTKKILTMKKPKGVKK